MFVNNYHLSYVTGYLTNSPLQTKLFGQANEDTNEQTPEQNIISKEKIYIQYTVMNYIIMILFLLKYKINDAWLVSKRNKG